MKSRNHAPASHDAEVAGFQQSLVIGAAHRAVSSDSSAAAKKWWARQGLNL
ncbi:hypothetical protein [Consotaella aegiceratis]|uniref:hypothetical protein n=1 Tax=Consotaella aegiceratis TaxID=3097961 RepID=UPI002F40A189